MRKLIKSIREYLELSQTEFADKIGVTFATVNRWENGRAIPTKLAQSTLYEYCKEHGVPVYQMILEKIKADADAVSLDGDRILLYHGSKSGIVGEIAPKSREMCDFGKGFYMGTDPGQPLTLICDFEKSKFYVVSVDMKNLDTIEIKADLDWAMLVAYHRGRMEQIKDTALYDKYSRIDAGKDIVIGSIANDRMFYVLDNFFTGVITDMALVNSLSALKLGKQYVATTEKACTAVRIEKEIPLSLLERRFLQDRVTRTVRRAFHLPMTFAKTIAATANFLTKFSTQPSKGGNHGRHSIQTVRHSGQAF